MSEDNETIVSSLSGYRKNKLDDANTETVVADGDIAEVIDLKKRGSAIAAKRYEKSLRVAASGFHRRAHELGRESDTIGTKANEILTRKKP